MFTARLLLLTGVSLSTTADMVHTVPVCSNIKFLFMIKSNFTKSKLLLAPVESSVLDFLSGLVVNTRLLCTRLFKEACQYTELTDVGKYFDIDADTLI